MKKTITLLLSLLLLATLIGCQKEEIDPKHPGEFVGNWQLLQANEEDKADLEDIYYGYPYIMELNKDGTGKWCFLDEASSNIVWYYENECLNISLEQFADDLDSYLTIDNVNAFGPTLQIQDLTLYYDSAKGSDIRFIWEDIYFEVPSANGAVEYYPYYYVSTYDENENEIMWFQVTDSQACYDYDEEGNIYDVNLDDVINGKIYDSEKYTSKKGIEFYIVDRTNTFITEEAQDYYRSLLAVFDYKGKYIAVDMDCVKEYNYKKILDSMEIR